MPYNAQAGTGSSPSGSRSSRVSLIVDIRSVSGPLVPIQESVMGDESFFEDVLAHATFGDAVQKRDCFRSERLFVGVNYFKADQIQKIHIHAQADKFYLVIR